MAKVTTTLAAPASTATATELADEARRSYEASGGGASLPPGLNSDTCLSAGVERLLDACDLEKLLLEGHWTPSTPLEVVAALRALAGSIFAVQDPASTPTLPSLEEHVIAIESLITGQDVQWLMALDSEYNSGPFHRLYQDFKEERGAGRGDAGLHQRLTQLEAERRALEARVKALEEQLHRLQPVQGD